MRLITNKTGGEALLHFTLNSAGTETVTIAGAQGVSNVAASANETVNTATITQIYFGSSSGASAYWTVKRGANIVAVLDSTGWVDFAGNGAALKLDGASNLTVELVGTAPGYLIIELQKQSTIANDQYLVN